MKKLPQISEAEFEVMKIVWKHAPINTNEITEKLTKTTTWSQDHTDPDQTSCDKGRPHLRKTEPGVCLHPPGKRERIYRTGEPLFSETFLQWRYHRYGFCLHREG